MRIGNRLFPYPILNNNPYLNSFKSSKFSINPTVLQEGAYFILKDTVIETNNKKIIEMVQNNEVSGSIVVECSSTIYRENFEISFNKKDIRIPITLLRGKVSVSAFLYAYKDLPGYENDDFLDIYKGFKFNLDKLALLAVDDGFDTFVEYEEEESKKTSSIFLISKSENVHNELIDIKLSKKKIILNLSQYYFDTYQSLKNNPLYKDEFFSLMTVPALVHALRSIVWSDSDDLEDIYNEYSWFRTINTAYSKIHKQDLTAEKFKELQAYTFAQEILNYPLTKVFEQISRRSVDLSIFEE
jgi:hypothetical protein